MCSIEKNKADVNADDIRRKSRISVDDGVDSQKRQVKERNSVFHYCYVSCSGMSSMIIADNVTPLCVSVVDCIHQGIGGRRPTYPI